MRRVIAKQSVKHSAVYLLYLGIAVVITWPLITVMESTLFGGFLTDAYQTARHIWWIQHALSSGQSVIFQPALGYPDGLHGAWLWANPLEYFPGWLFAFALPVNSATNLMLLTQLALNGWAVYVLARHLTRHEAAALLAGLIFLAYPALQSRIYGGHVGVLALWPLPLYLYALHRLAGDRRRRWFALAAILFALSSAGNSTLLVYYLLPVTAVFCAYLLLTGQTIWLRRSLLAIAIGGVLALTLLVPLALETRSTPQYNPEIGGSVTYSADLLAVVSPSFFHPLFEHLDYPRRVLGVNLLEGTGYLGIVVVALALVGVLRRRAAHWWLALALIAWALSLGPLLKVFDQPVTVGVDDFATYIAMPWAFFQRLPVFDISRTPGRFNLTLGLALAIMAGYGAAIVWRWLTPRLRLRWRGALWLALAALILFEYQTFWPMPSDDARVPAAVRALAENADGRAVFDVPWDNRLLAKRGLWLQAYHQQPVLAGQFIRDTPVNPARLAVLQATLDPALLNAAGVGVVIWHKEGGAEAARLGQRARDQLGAPWFEDDRLALFDVPASGAEPDFVAVPAFDADEPLTTSGAVYLYAPAPGWFDLDLRLRPDPDNGEARTVSLLLDNAPVNRWSVAAHAENMTRTLYLPEAGFYTARLELDPPCPQAISPALTCHALAVDALVARFVAEDEDGVAGVTFERHLTLRRADLDAERDALTVRLWWDAGQPMGGDDVRFVHVIGPDGAQVAGLDSPPGAFAGQWMESLSIDLPPNLAPGAYRVYTGWYRYPSLERFAVLDDRPEAVNRLVQLGAFSIDDDET